MKNLGKTQNHGISFQTHYKRDANPERYEIPYGASETIQGQAYSIRELLEKFVSGAVPDIGKVPQYEENPEFETTDILRSPGVDIVDVHEEIETIRARSKNARKSQSEPNRQSDDTGQSPEPGSPGEGDPGQQT